MVGGVGSCLGVWGLVLGGGWCLVGGVGWLLVVRGYGLGVVCRVCTYPCRFILAYDTLLVV